MNIMRRDGWSTPASHVQGRNNALRTTLARNGGLLH
jgi:hypothetical protein